MMIPEDISANNALKELMYERLRNLRLKMIVAGSM